MNKELKIGLFGFGVVGEGIYQVLKQTPGLDAYIKRVCILHEYKERNAPRALFTTSSDELLFDPEINVIVELIDNADDAYLIVKKALLNGKSVVSANKKMIAAHLPELINIAEKHGGSFLYEAAVCGSIPIIRNLEEYYDNDLLNSFTGIVNGSTNYILTRICDEGLSFEEALAEAQRLGFAESDPSLDVEGKDAVNKLCIVLKHAYGLEVRPDNIIHKGISSLHPADAVYAAEKGKRIKLVARATVIANNNVNAWVLPEFSGPESRLYTINNEYNGVLLGSSLSDEQFLAGKGAGRYPTASAVLSDISSLRYGYRYEYRKSASSNRYKFVHQQLLRVYVSFNSGTDISTDDFETIEEEYTGRTRNYFTGIISLDKLASTGWLERKDVSVIVVGVDVDVVDVVDAVDVVEGVV